MKNVVNGHGYDEGLFSFKSVGCERMFQELTAQYGDDPELKEACFIANCGLMLTLDACPHEIIINFIAQNLLIFNGGR